MLGALTVSGAVTTPPAARRADDQRHRHIAEHAWKFYGMVVNLIHAQGEKVGEHHFGHRLESGERKADGSTRNACLADRRRDHPTGEVGRKALGHLERAAVGIMQVLPEQQHLRNGLQQVPQRCIDRLAYVPACRRFGIVYACLDRQGGAEDVLGYFAVPSLRRRFGQRLDLVDEAGVARFDATACCVGKATAERGQWIAAANFVHLLTGAQIIALAVWPHAASIEDEKSGPTRRSYLGHDSGYLVTEVRVVVAQMPRGASKRRAAFLDAAANGFPRIRGLCNAVVLYDH